MTEAGEATAAPRGESAWIDKVDEWRWTVRDLGRVPISELHLDPVNPRLPERVQGGDQTALLEYLFENDVLDELAASFVANGYFDNEPILVLPPDVEGFRVVVEGNRRVSTLKVLLSEPVAREADLSFDLSTLPSDLRLAELSQVPAFEVDDREELGAYLGYRHIGGIRPWPAESKARWIHRSVVAAAQSGTGEPFYEVGRVFGSNARGVRTSYLTLELLRRARAQHGVNTSYVERNRYSVWGLLVANSRVREYIKLDSSARTYAAIQAALDEVDGERIAQVVEDLTPTSLKPAVLGDSRQVSTYAEVISDERARSVLRAYGDLTLAAAVLEQGALTQRLTTVARSMREILVDASRLDVQADTAVAATEVAELSRSVRAVIVDRLPGDD